MYIYIPNTHQVCVLANMNVDREHFFIVFMFHI